MADEDLRQKLTAILSADVKDYSRLLSQDRVSTVRTLNEHREMFTSFIQQYGGRIVDMPGDNILALLDSVSDAVNCAAEIQRELAERNTGVPSARMMQWRIGINLGDVMEEDDKVYGDGINIAARVEGLAEPGAICVSGRVYDQVYGKLGLEFEFLGEQTVKNIADPVRAYRIPLDASGTADTSDGLVAVDKKWRRIAIVAVSLLIIVGGLWVSREFGLRSAAPSNVVTKAHKATPAQDQKTTLSDRPSIAVLPFDNMSGETDQEYFADAMTEAIITRLSKSPLLFVISRNSTFTYRGKPTKAPQIGEELGARYVVEGSVQKIGDTLRITAQLISAKADRHVWSETYDREYSVDSLLGIQDDISGQISGAALSGHKESERERVKRIPTTDLNAYDSYWRAMEYYHQGTEESHTKARTFAERAVHLDQEFAEAYALLGDIYWSYRWTGWGLEAREAKDRAQEMAQRAIANDAGNARAHYLLARTYAYSEAKDKAIAEAELAIALDPNNADAYAAMSDVLAGTGRYEEALAAIDNAVRLDPHGAAGYALSFGGAYVNLGRYAEAITSLNRAHSVEADNKWLYLDFVNAYLHQWATQQSDDERNLARAVELAAKATELSGSSPLFISHLGYSYLMSEQYEQAEVHIRNGWSISPDDPISRAFMGYVYNRIGKPEKTIELLENTEYLETSAPGTACVLSRLGWAYYLTGRYAEAVSTQKESFRRKPAFHKAFETRIQLTVTYVALGLMDKARAEAEEVLKMSPNFSVEVWGERIPYKDKSLVRNCMDALRKAGLK